MIPPQSSKLEKCKSSNTADVAKVERSKNKKTKSLGETLEKAPQAKRRGVYVQKKHEVNDKANTQETKTAKTPEKPKSQVFTLTSNAGSQFPLAEEHKIVTQSLDSAPSKNTKRFRSKFLSKNGTSNAVEVTILKSTRDIVTTPSVISEEKSFQNMNSIMKWVDSRIDSKLLKAKENDVGILKYEPRNTEARNVSEKRVKIMEDGPAIIDHFKRDDCKLQTYNSYIDLMARSSFDGQDSEFGSNSASRVTIADSKTNLQMDDVNAKMLNMGKDYNRLKKDKHYNLTIDEYDYDRIARIKKYSYPPPPKPKKRFNNMQSASFDYKKKKNPLQSFSFRNRVSENRKRKNNFLEVLKDELQKDSSSFHYEPPSFYDALKVLARVKGQKTIHFDERSVRRNDRRHQKSPELTSNRRNLLRDIPKEDYEYVYDTMTNDEEFQRSYYPEPIRNDSPEYSHKSQNLLKNRPLEYYNDALDAGSEEFDMTSSSEPHSVYETSSNETF